MNRKHLILIILLAGLVLSLGYAWWAMPRQQRIAEGGTNGTASTETGQARKAQDNLPHIRFELLGDEPAPFPGAARDIFSFYVKPVETAPAPPAPPPPPPRPTVSAPEPPPRPVVQKPLPSFNFLGFLEIDQEKIVFLSSGEEIYLVREGDRFGRQEEFEAADISGNVLTVNQSGRASPVKVYLVEKEKPDASVSAPARLSPLPPVPAVEPTDNSQGMSAPARRSRSGGVSSPSDRVRFEADIMDNQNGSEPPEPSVDTGNPEGEMNGTSQ